MSEHPNEQSGDTIGEDRFLAVFRTAQARREQRLSEARANFASDVSDAEGAYAREIADGLFPEVSPSS